MKYSSAYTGIIAVIAAALMLSGCGKQKSASILVCGSTTIEPYMRRASRIYEDLTGTEIIIGAPGSKDGIDSLLAGSCDIAMSSMETDHTQLDTAMRNGIELKPFLLGYDIIVPVVHPENSVSDISYHHLRQVYSGRVRSWSELGGRNSAIDVVERTHASGTYSVWHTSIVPDRQEAFTIQEMSSNSAVLGYVASHRDAIGYISHAYLNPEVKALKLDGISTDNNEILLSHYPLKRPLLLYVNAEKFTEEIREFIVFLIINERGRKLLSESGFFYSFRDGSEPIVPED